MLVRPDMALAAALIAALALTTAWSMSMLPRHRDVVVTVQTANALPLR